MSSNNKIVHTQFNKNTNNRGGVLKYVGLFVVLLAIFGMIFSSFSTGFGGGNVSELTFGRYGNKDIVYSYDNAFGRAVDSALEQYSDTEEPLQGFVNRLAWQNAFNDIVLRTAVLYGTEESGYVPSPRAVDREIIELEGYQTNGEFDPQKYSAVSVATKKILRNELREQKSIETWSADTLGGVYRSEKQLDFLNNMKSSLRTYDYMTLPYDEYPDEELIRYAKEKPELFRKKPLSRITVEEETQATELLTSFEEQRQNIDAFSTLAQEHSTDTYKEDGGTLGAFEYYKLLEILSEEQADEVFALESGNIAGPYDTEYGWILFHSDGEIEASDPENSLDTIRSYMRQNELGIIEDYLMAKAENLRSTITEENGFKEALENEGYEVKTTKPFAVNYGDDDLIGGSPSDTEDPLLSGTASSKQFWKTILALKEEGDVSQALALTDAVALFSLVSTEEQEKQAVWGDLVQFYASQSWQSELEKIVVDEESKLFINNFTETYNKIFQTQG